MTTTTLAECSTVVPDGAGLTFDVLGISTERDVDLMKIQIFQTNGVPGARLQDLWVRHPDQQG